MQASHALRHEFESHTGSQTKVVNMELGYFIETAKRVHGELPVVIISERLVEYDDRSEAFETKYSGTYAIDLAKIDEDFESKFRYVERILEAAITGSTRWTSSLKYSFTDTDDWWTVYLADTTDGRKVLSIDVELNF